MYIQASVEEVEVDGGPIDGGPDGGSSTETSGRDYAVLKLVGARDQ